MKEKDQEKDQENKSVKIGVADVKNKDAELPKSKREIALDGKDQKWLKKNKYNEICNRFSKIFVLQNKKHPSKIAELRAASPVHACSLIHWKPNQVRIIEIKEVETK